MINLVSLLAVAALVSLQCDFVANAQIDNTKIDLDNNMQPNVIQPKTTKKRWYLVVSQPPPKTARLIPGSTLELTCKVGARPAPLVHWLKNGEPISDFDDTNEIAPVYTSSFGEMTSKIVIQSTTSGDVYTCVGTAGALKKTASTTVYIDDDQDDVDPLEKLLFMPTKPTITRFYNFVFLPMDNAVILPCRAVSSSKSKIFWHGPDGNLIYNNGHLRVLPSGDLLINDLSFEDMGGYTCTAHNLYGKDTVEMFVYTMKS